MVQDFKNSMANAFQEQDYMTIEEVSKELNVGKQRARQIIDAALSKRLIQKLTKKDGVRVLYAEPMVEQLRDLHQKNAFGIPKNTKRKSMGLLGSFAKKNAELVLEVPVFDANGKDILLQRFGSADGIVEFLKTILMSEINPVKSQLEDLEKEFEHKKKLLLASRSR